MERVAVIVVAGGRGFRAGGDKPKQYQVLAGIPLLRHALLVWTGFPEISVIQAVIAADDRVLFDAAAAGVACRPPVSGGATRQQSVHAGLEALAADAPDLVLIHDAARPFVKRDLAMRAIASASRTGAAVPALPLSDTVKSVADGTVTGTLDRAALRTVQTPQAFRFETILAAHRQAAAAGRTDFTDDAALAEWAGQTVTVFEGDPGNVKITTAEDLAHAEMRWMMARGDVRTATGFDVHAFADGDHVMLGGVAIPHSRGLSGHSDADVVLHALVDALLGALADGDIGSHFPPSDPQWRGASSDRFLMFAIERVRARGGVIAHLDVTVVCEAPKVGPHRDAIRARIAEIAGLPLHRVAVKATTSERLGFTGRGEGIAAMATATIRLPFIEDDAIHGR